MTEVDPNEVKEMAISYRREKGLTQRQLAALVHTTPGLIGEIERGKCRSSRVAKEIRALTLADLAEV